MSMLRGGLECIERLSVVTDTEAVNGFDSEGVLVTVEAQIERLRAVREAQRARGEQTAIAARTHAAVSCLLQGRGRGVDQAYLLGTTNLTVPRFKDCAAALMRRLGALDTPVAPRADTWLETAGVASLIERERAAAGRPGDAVFQQVFRQFVQSWQRQARLRTFGEAVAEMMDWPIMDSPELPMPPAQWREFAHTNSYSEVRERADAMLGSLPNWDCEHARTLHGEYQVRGCLDYAIARSLALAPHADVLWLVAPSADLHAACRFANAINARFPGKPLAYQLAPSSGEAAFTDDADRRSFDGYLRQLGFSAESS